MPSMSTFSAIAIGLLILPSALAAGSCPDGSTPSTSNGKSVCCPGILSTNVCLVGCTLQPPSCFPFCSDGTPNSLTTAGTCTTVSFDDPAYTSKAYASASNMPQGNSASATTGSGNGTTASAATATNTGSSSSGNAGSKSSSSGNAAAAITEAPMLAIAGAIAAYALF